MAGTTRTAAKRDMRNNTANRFIAILLGMNLVAVGLQALGDRPPGLW
jgi:hypothetical protein